MTFYDVLGIRENATDEEIRASYLRLAQQYHPDRVVGEATEDDRAHFKAIQEAYEVLHDPDKRREYHRQIIPQPRADRNRSSAQNNAHQARRTVRDVPNDWLQRNAPRKRPSYRIRGTLFVIVMIALAITVVPRCSRYLDAQLTLPIENSEGKKEPNGNTFDDSPPLMFSLDMTPPLENSEKRDQSPVNASREPAAATTQDTLTVSKEEASASSVRNSQSRSRDDLVDVTPTRPDWLPQSPRSERSLDDILRSNAKGPEVWKKPDVDLDVTAPLPNVVGFRMQRSFPDVTQPDGFVPSLLRSPLGSEGVPVPPVPLPSGGPLFGIPVVHGFPGKEFGGVGPRRGVPTGVPTNAGRIDGLAPSTGVRSYGVPSRVDSSPSSGAASPDFENSYSMPTLPSRPVFESRRGMERIGLPQ